MSRALIISYMKTHDRIRTTGNCWIRQINGKWHHTFDRATVKARLLEIGATIEVLHYRNPYEHAANITFETPV